MKILLLLFICVNCLKASEINIEIEDVLTQYIETSQYVFIGEIKNIMESKELYTYYNNPSGKKIKIYKMISVRVEDNVVNIVPKNVDMFFNLAPIGVTSNYGYIPEFHPKLKNGERYIFLGKIDSRASLEQRQYIININLIVNIKLIKLLKDLAEKSTKFYKNKDSLGVVYIEHSVSKKDFFTQQKWNKNKIRNFKKINFIKDTNCIFKIGESINFEILDSLYAGMYLMEIEKKPKCNVQKPIKDIETQKQTKDINTQKRLISKIFVGLSVLFLIVIIVIKKRRYFR